MKAGTDKRGGTSAYLTVYLALIMAVLISLCLALLEGVRSNAIRLEAECVADIGFNSIFAEYHRGLFEQYNLFAIDSAYGCGYPGKENTTRQLRYYIEENLSMEDIFLEDLLYRDFLAIGLEEVELTGVTLLTDGNGQVFRRRAVEAIQEDVGLTLLEDLKEWIKTVEEHRLNERDVMAEKQQAEEELADIRLEVSEKEWKTGELEKPTEALEALYSQGILATVVDNPQTLSNKAVVKDNLLTTRMEADLLNVGNMSMEETSEWEELTERFFFQEYLLEYMGRYGATKDISALDYQMEYLISGKDNDNDNLKAMANTLCFIRAAANASYLFADPEKCTEAELLGLALGTLICLPEAGSLFKTIILCGWVYAESVYDVKTILAGGRIPLLKNDASWHYSLDDALLGNIQTEATETEGLSYEDYLRIFMVLTDLDTLTGRAMDMVEADIRLTPGNAGFRLDGCYDGVEVYIRMESAYGYSCEMVRKKQYSLY